MKVEVKGNPNIVLKIDGKETVINAQTKPETLNAIFKPRDEAKENN